MRTTSLSSQSPFAVKAVAGKLRLPVLAILFCFWHSLTFAQAPTISYSGPQTYNVGTAVTLAPTVTGGAAPAYNGAITYGSGIGTTISIAPDAAGNVYVVDLTHSLVKKIPAGNGAPVTWGSGFSVPYGVAVDATGNVYVADSGAGLVKKIPAGNGAPVTIGTGFSSPYGVAVDIAGNVYVTDENSVTKIPAGGGSTVRFGGFSSPTGIAVDAAGNVYVADNNNNRVAKIPAGGGPIVTVGPAFNQPVGVAVDAAGNLYVTELGNHAIKEIPAGGGAPVTLVSGISSLYCVAIDAKGNLYFGGSFADNVQKLTPAGGYFLNAALPAGLSFDSNTGVISGTPTATSPAINYTITAYNAVGSATAAVNIKVNIALPGISYSSPQTYVTGTAIAPLTPTVTGGAAQAYNSAITYGSGIDEPFSIAADAAGNVYVVDLVNHAVKEIPAAGGAAVTIGSGFSIPYGVAADAAGNVYVADEGADLVKKIPAGNGAPVTIGTGFSFAFGVAVDAAGNVYVTDASANSVTKIPADGGAAVGFGGFSNPTGIAVDAGGNVYVADYNHSRVAKIPAGGGPIVTVGSGFATPVGVAVDAAGNLYVADANNSAIKEIPAGGGAPVTLASGIGSLACVAIDAKGNLYFGGNAGSVQKLTPAGGYFLNAALPAGLSFNSNTGVISGTPTAISPATDYTVTAFNSAGSSTATVNIKVNLALPVISYSSPQTYGTGTAIAPLTPAVVGVAGPGYSSPVAVSTISVGTALATDTAGNIYTTDGLNIFKAPAGGGTAVLAGYANPTGPGNIKYMAIDPASNVYVARGGGARSVSKLPADGSPAVTLASGFSSSFTVAADAAGNVYVADRNNRFVKEIPAGGGAPVTLASGFDAAAIATDGGGNIFIVDATNGAVKELFAGGGAATYVTGINDITDVTGLAVDAAGNIFITETNGKLDKIAAPIVAGKPAVIITMASAGGVDIVPAVATDNAGNVYISDFGFIKKFTPAGGYYINKPLPAGLSLDAATGIISGTPTAISPAADYKITAYNSSGGTPAGVNITVKSTDATLSNLTISSGTLTPAFAAGTTSYTANVTNATASITVTPTTGDANAAVKVNGATVTSGTASASLPLVVGPNTITTIVTPQDGVSTKTYTVIVTRAAAAVNANLAGLAISNGTLSPVFAAAKTSYKATVANSITSITLTPTAADGNATITVNGATVASGSASASLPLNPGPNVITTVVTAQDGVTVDTYTLTVTRTPSTNAGLGNLRLNGIALSPTFTPANTSYTASVAAGFTSTTVTPITSVAGSTVTVNGVAVASGSPSGSIPINTGINTITTIVTAQDGITTRTYTVIVTRVSNNANILKVKLSSGTLTPAFAQTTTSYAASVTNAVSSITVTPTASDVNATVKVNGTVVASGTASAAIALNVGSNTITVIATATNGTTTKTYTITVTRAAPVIDASLAGLSISSGTLSPVFAPATLSYAASVANATTSVTVTPTASAGTSTVTVNGATVSSGTASAGIPLNVGPNIITVVVTAFDGTTTKSYTVTVTRAASSNANIVKIKLSSGTLSPVFAQATTSYTASVANTVTSITVTPTTSDANATVKVNGATVVSGTASAAITVNVGSNIITAVCTAQDGVTAKTYTITVTRAMAGANSLYEPIGVANPSDRPQFANHITVHPGVSPNGDGMNDVLVIDGITAYPDNKLSIMSRNGELVFEASGYDNSARVFDGHSNKNGKMQSPGTYFYSLEYKVGEVTKHKTGFIVLKY